MSTFIDACDKAFLGLGYAGFLCYRKEVNDDYELIQWRKGIYELELYMEKYEYSLTLSFSAGGTQIDTSKLLEMYSIPFRERYEYSDSNGIQKGIEYFSSALNFLAREMDTPDFKAKAYACKIEPLTEWSYHLEMADNLYLSGKFDEAQKWYERYEIFLNKMQKKRLERIRKQKK